MVSRATGRMRPLDRAAAAATGEAGERKGLRAKVGHSPLEISLRRVFPPAAWCPAGVCPAATRPLCLLLPGCTRASAPGLGDSLAMCAEGAVDAGETRAPRAASCVSWFFGSPSPRACEEDHARCARATQRCGGGVALGHPAGWGSALVTARRRVVVRGRGERILVGTFLVRLLRKQTLFPQIGFLADRGRAAGRLLPPPLHCYNCADREGSRCVAWEGRWVDHAGLQGVPRHRLTPRRKCIRP